MIFSKSSKIRLKFFFVITLVASIVFYFVYSNLQKNVVYFYSPQEIKNLTNTPSNKIRLGGLVKEGSLKKNNNNYVFIITDLKNEIFHYQENNTWITNKQLPPNYGGYSLYKKERVILTDFEGDNPEQLIKIHRKMYPYNAKGRIQRPDQPTLLGDSVGFLE